MAFAFVVLSDMVNGDHLQQFRKKTVALRRYPIACGGTYSDRPQDADSTTNSVYAVL